MIQTLRKPIPRTPPRQEGHVHSVKPSTRAIRHDITPDRDPAALAASLREVSVTAHRALKMGGDRATMSRLAARIEGIARGFRALGLDDLARFAETLKRKVETGE